MTQTDTLTIAIISLDIAYGDRQANIEAASRAIRSLAGTHVAVLPELFSTAFIPDAEATRTLAEPLSGPTVTALRKLSEETSVAICGSFISTDDGTRFHNRCFFITPGGRGYHYDKHHLFILGEETKIFTPGTALPPVIPYRGWNMAMACCYDLRFPCWLRNRTDRGALSYDAMIIPANWPDSRAYARHHLLIARAIENQAYCVFANRSGRDAAGTYHDLPEIIDYQGRPMPTSTQPLHPDGNIVSATLSLSKLTAHRKKFPFWQSADRQE